MPLPRTMTVALVSAICTLPAVAPLANAAPPPVPAPAAPYGVTWTVQPGANSLSEYAPKASGSDAPIATIRGAATGLNRPSAIVLSKAGRLFVTNAGNDSITEYAADATGNATPLATIAGPHTGLDAPSSVSVAGGLIWVTDPAGDLVESFSVGSNGDVLPAETIAGSKTHLNHPVAVAVSQIFPGFPDLSITVLNSPSAAKPSVISYLTSKRGNIAPDDEYTGTKKHPLVSPTALLSAGFGSFVIADSGNNSVTQYLALPGLLAPRALRSIAGSNTGLDAPSALCIDAFGHLVVANSGDQTVRVFGARARGNIAPLHVLTGVGTRSGSPAGVVVFGAAPGPPTDLKVKIHKTTAHMSWKPPAVTGGGLEGYEVLALRIEGGGSGGGGVVTVSDALRHGSVAAAQRGGRSVSVRGGGFGGIGFTKHTTFTQRGLKRGYRYVFVVGAVNGFGAGVSRPVLKALVIPPSAPRHVRVKPTRHSLAVTWKTPKLDGGQNLKRYDIEYATCVPGAKGCKFHTQHVPVTRGPLAAKRGFTRIKGLNPATRYYVRVVAENKSKVGLPSRAVAATSSG